MTRRNNIILPGIIVWLALLCSIFDSPGQSTNEPLPPAVILEIAGHVEVAASNSTNWQVAAVGHGLAAGDRVRTFAESRAAIQLSDRSIIRLNQRTTLEILAPRRTEKRRFGLRWGSLFFFNREKPADIEFDTPLAAGAIRGTEFVLEVTPDAQAVRLALIDGRVALDTAQEKITMERGEDLRLQAGQPPVKTALVNIPNSIQWALYYPAVLNPSDLPLTEGEKQRLSLVLKQYREGALIDALASWPAQISDSPPVAALHAAILLSVGRVSEAEKLLAQGGSDLPASIALQEMIGTIQAETVATNHLPACSSEWLARSYTLQARAELPAALGAARRASEMSPDFGFARARIAELEFSFGHSRRALSELERALTFSPRLPSGVALKGFILLARDDTAGALASFEDARRMDAALGSAWLGQGLCLMRERRLSEARAAFQAAAALEPQRGLFRSYLGKAASELGDSKSAIKELNLAKRLDPADPTAWLYSALELWQENRLNEALQDLEQSKELNDERALFRSRLLLDQDRAIRSANLAALYEDAGFPDVSRHEALRSVIESYANFSSHLFLSESYGALEDVNRFDLRFESARQSELLVANLLAPPGGGNLSQVLDQQQRIRFFDPQPIDFSSFTEYSSRGDWHEAASLFGSVRGFSYALDADYGFLSGQRPNNDFESRQFILTMKQRVSVEDEAYLQVGYFRSDSGDVASRYDPANATLGFRANETQEPTLYAGWHHAWSPGSHTLLLFARLDDHLSYTNPQPNVIFFQQPGGVITSVQTADFFPPFRLDYSSRFTLYSAELQQIWESDRCSLVLGGRWQSGQLDLHANLAQDALGIGFSGFATNQNISSTMDRGTAYAYSSWQVFDPLRLVAGLSYDHLSAPENTDFPPLAKAEVARDLVAPKVGALFTPWDRGLFRAAYTRSLGGLFFDNSVRLEPTQVGGFNQTFRNLIPESVVGLLPGATFETAGAGFDQSLRTGTWFGIEAQWLTSDGDRSIGVLTNGLPFPLHSLDSPSSTTEVLNYRERDLSAYAAQLLGDRFSVSASYRLSEADLTRRFPEIPLNLSNLPQDNRAVLHQVSLAANFNHPTGLFAQWESVWYHQNTMGTTALAADDFWQHNLFAGYRFHRRLAELRFGLLNIANSDYRLNPLNLHADLPRNRTFTASLRLNF